MFIDRQGAADDCVATQMISSALALACVANSTAVSLPDAGLPPHIQTAADIGELEVWLGRARAATTQATRRLFVQNVPTRVVDQFKTQQIDSLGKGDHGADLSELVNQLEALHHGWTHLSSGLDLVLADVESARTEIDGIQIRKQQLDLGVAKERLELDRQEALRAVSSAQNSASLTMGIVSGVAQDMSGDPFALIGLGKTAEDSLFAEQKDQIDEQFIQATGDNLTATASTNTDATGNSIGQVVDSLNKEMIGNYQSIDDSLSEMRVSARGVTQKIQALDQNQASAQYDAAQAAGADYALVQGKLFPIPLNIVLRRQYDLTRRRYEAALATAKRAAYLARRSIEEKIGVRLDTLTQNIGPLPPPKQWVDDVCTVTGIDYKALSSAPDGGVVDAGADAAAATAAENTLIGQFADQFIGDYVAKLAEFVEFYNVQYPFREASDTAVISVRDQLLKPDDNCLSNSKNLLYYSDALSTTGTMQANGASIGGWHAKSCAPGDTCVVSSPGAALVNPMNTAVVPPAAIGGLSWLQAIPSSEFPPSLAASSSPDTNDPSPKASVYQSVQVQAGTNYVVSWWDMARAADGGPSGSGTPSLTPSVYDVGVYSSDWKLIAIATQKATDSGTAGTTWSDRKTLQFTAVSDDTYHLAFIVAEPGTSRTSLAISDVQLEALTANSASASGYQSTAATRSQSGGNCKLDAAGFRKRFSRNCYGGPGSGQARECFWELNDMMVIDAEAIQRRESPLVGQIAAGNYNMRHGTVSLNAVGTGVINCAEDSSASCFGTGFVEYDLEHSAFNIPIISTSDAIQCFDFGAATIVSGKALAAERYITQPIAAADSALLAQPAMQKPEFSGRPLSGIYHLRIKDSPTLAWDHIEDIQMVLNYSYWSKVSTGSPSN